MQYWWSYKINFRCRLGLDVNTEDTFDNILQSPKYKQNMSDSKFVKIGRTSRRRCYIKIAVLKNFEIFTGKHPCQSLFSNKVVDLLVGTFLKKRLQHRCFPVNIVKFLRTPILKDIFKRLLLNRHGTLRADLNRFHTLF